MATTLSQTEINDFCQYYKKSAIEYMEKFQLGVIGEYLNTQHVRLRVYPINQLEAANRHSSHDVALNKIEEIRPHITMKFPDENINWREYEEDFYLSLYKGANSSQKKVLQNSFVMGYSVRKITKCLAADPEMLFECLTHSSIFYFELLKDKYDNDSSIPIWKEKLSPSQFDSVIEDFFNQNKGEVKKVKTGMRLQFILEKYVTNETLYHKFSQWFPEKEEINPFVEGASIIFEVNVSKEKLMKLVTLPNKKSYSSMHWKIVEVLNKEETKKALNIISAQTDTDLTHFKSLNLLIKANEGTDFTESRCKKLLVQLYKSYIEMDLVNHDLETEWVTKNLLEVVLSHKPKSVIKIAKI